jgi:preprotein translocase subunit SecG
VTLLPTYVAAVWDIVQGIVLGLFMLSGFLLTIVVLLQEGKGGGIAGAFGGAGAEAFGVKAGTVNRFTAYVGTAFLGLALVYAGIASRINQPTNPDQPSKLAPADYIGPVVPGDGSGDSLPGGAPPEGTPPGGSTPPATPGTPPEPVPPVEKPKDPVPPTPAPAPAPEQPKAPPPVPPAMGG